MTEVGWANRALNKKAMPPMITLFAIRAKARAASFVEIEVFMTKFLFSVTDAVIEVFR
jgi:hypothetical protein